MNEELKAFVNSLDQYNWFCDAEVDTLGRFVVYVDRMDIPFIGSTPDMIGGYHVLFHFIASQPIHTSPSRVVTIEPEELVEEFPLDEVETNLDFLISELDRLEKLCGSNILQDIFYEVHDGKNAVTNLSAKFTEVRESLNELYENYGFDLIYEELDG